MIGNSASRVPSTKMHWVIQSETEISSNIPDPATQGHIEIDWVAVWVPA